MSSDAIRKLNQEVLYFLIQFANRLFSGVYAVTIYGSFIEPKVKSEITVI
jgi:hypothetical protein